MMTEKHESAKTKRGMACIFLLAILGVGIFLRTFDLEGRCLWGDENESYNRANQPLSETVLGLLHTSPHTPLYYVFLSGWLSFGKSDAYARAPSCFFGVASIFVSWLLLRRLTGREEAILATLFLALSPIHVMFSRIVREYSLLSLLSAISLYFFFLLCRSESKNPKWWILYGCSNLSLLYLHYYSGLLIFAQGLFVLISCRQKLKTWLCCHVWIGIAFFPWMGLNVWYGLRGEWIGMVHEYASSSFGPLVKSAYFFYNFILGETVNPFLWNFTIPFGIFCLALFVAGIREILKVGKTIGKFILTLCFVPIGTGLFFPVLGPKQLLPVLPLFYLIIATGIFRIKNANLKWAAVVLLIGGFCYSHFNYFSNRQYFDVDMITPWREMTQTIQSREKNQEAVIISGPKETHMFGFDHYYKGLLPVYRISSEEDFEQISRYTNQYDRVWILLRSGPGRDSFEEWVSEHGNVVDTYSFLYEEESLKGLRESLKNIHKYRVYKYKLYVVSGKSDHEGS